MHLRLFKKQVLFKCKIMTIIMCTIHTNSAVSLLLFLALLALRFATLASTY